MPNDKIIKRCFKQGGNVMRDYDKPKIEIIFLNDDICSTSGLENENFDPFESDY